MAPDACVSNVWRGRGVSNVLQVREFTTVGSFIMEYTHVCWDSVMLVSRQDMLKTCGPFKKAFATATRLASSGAYLKIVGKAWESPLSIFIPGLSQTYHHLRNSKINRSEKGHGFGCHAEEGKNAMKHFNLEAPVEKNMLKPWRLAQRRHILGSFRDLDTGRNGEYLWYGYDI